VLDSECGKTLETCPRYCFDSKSQDLFTKDTEIQLPTISNKSIATSDVVPPNKKRRIVALRMQLHINRTTLPPLSLQMVCLFFKEPLVYGSRCMDSSFVVQPTLVWILGEGKDPASARRSTPFDD
jgi:hypothetical protein